MTLQPFCYCLWYGISGSDRYGGLNCSRYEKDWGTDPHLNHILDVNKDQRAARRRPSVHYWLCSVGQWTSSVTGGTRPRTDIPRPVAVPQIRGTWLITDRTPHIPIPRPHLGPEIGGTPAGTSAPADRAVSGSRSDTASDPTLNFEGRVSHHNAEVDRHNADIRSHNAKVRVIQVEAARFQGEADRFQEEADCLYARGPRLNAEADRLQAQATRLQEQIHPLLGEVNHLICE